MLRSFYFSALLFLFVISPLTILAQSGRKFNIPALFNQVPDTPQVYYYGANNIKFPAGGHLQGIQGWNLINTRCAIITANSKKFSYYFIARISLKKDEYQLDSLHHLLPSPYRHAGGCQLSGEKVFVGLEDNRLKNKSVLAAIDLDSDSFEIIAPRHGAYKRSTAGATGAVKTGNNTWLIVVGDWNSDYFDCYQYKPGVGCDSITTFSLPQTGKKCAYQSINLFKGENGSIYMLGTGTDATGNRADIFELKSAGNTLQPALLQTRYFKCTQHCSFRYAAGASLTAQGKLILYATPRRAGKSNVVNVFGMAD